MISDGALNRYFPRGERRSKRLSKAPTPWLRPWLSIAVVSLAIHGPPAFAGQSQSEFCRKLVQALNEGDLTVIEEALHPNLVLTSVTGEVCRGKTETLAYLQRSLTGPDPSLRKLEVALDGEIGWSPTNGGEWLGVGRTKDEVRLANGVRFQTTTSWSCLLNQEGDGYLVRGIHLSTNPFRHPVLRKAKTTVAWSSIVAAITGLALGLFMGWLWGTSRKQKTR